MIHLQNSALEKVAGAQPVVSIGLEQGVFDRAHEVVEATSCSDVLRRDRHADLKLDGGAVAGTRLYVKMQTEASIALYVYITDITLAHYFDITRCVYIIDISLYVYN